MHTPTILLIAAAASAAVAAPITLNPTNPTDSTNKINYNAPVAKALASAGMVDTEGHCMHPLHDGLAYPPRSALYAADTAAVDTAAASRAAMVAMDTAAVDAARASVVAGHVDEEEEETQEQYNKKLVKMDKAREHGVVCTVL
ncbi:uncharacterized protein J4E84_007283 [Alternaria hordeiaustralica]|uniref:uncharacterized protein n=1 Tax=Alternaria hordeiaustralica TaxID=1187925 RepID=UPI0020C38464|nr:uncharacterized protein J4E84_007283 [Alternaria hordeiaustralica]KAI4682818.1 hypothetical protein J4E84_007283 [Alternaria hordeiaustralica]